jgi:O-methyltransferase
VTLPARRDDAVVAPAVVRRRPVPRGLARWLPVRRGTGSRYRQWQSLYFLVARDRVAVARFLRARWPVDVSLAARLRLLRRFVAITNQVRAYHTQAEMLTVADAILARAGTPGLTVVECGCGKGASTAKLSLVCALAGARLLAFDSFRGVPPNVEQDAKLDGTPVRFFAGAFRGRLAEVRRTVVRFGAPEVVTYQRGWFAETLRDFAEPVDVVLLDVDLVASTRTCLAAVWPLLRPGGVVFSQDAHLRGVVALLGDAAFWASLGTPAPRIEGLGREKLVALR